MCCCRTNIAKCIVTTSSVFTILGGVVIIIISLWLLLNADSTLGFSSDTKGFDVTLGDVAKRIVAASAIVGIVAILYGIMGTLVARMEKTICICLFGFLSSIMLVGFAAAAYAMIQLYSVKPEQIKDFCEAEVTNVTGPLEELIGETREYIHHIDQSLEDSVGTYMCTTTCPCVGIDFDKWDSDISTELKSN